MTTEHQNRYAICTVEDVRAELKIDESVTSYDEAIRRQISGVSRLIETYTGWTFAARDVVLEKYDGTGTDELLLKHNPIISVSQILLDDVEVTSAEYVIYNDIGKIALLDDAVFTLGRQIVEISYRYGFEAQNMPEDIVMACRTWVCARFKVQDKQRWGVQSQTVTEESFAFDNSPMPPDVRQILDLYRGLR